MLLGKVLKFLLFMLIVSVVIATFGGCGQTPLTPPELDARIEHELDRQEKFALFQYVCDKLRGTLYVQYPVRRCPKRSSVCMPHRLDWDFHYMDAADIMPGAMDWRPNVGNNLTCVRWGVEF